MNASAHLPSTKPRNAGLFGKAIYAPQNPISRLHVHIERENSGVARLSAVLEENIEIYHFYELATGEERNDYEKRALLLL